MLQNTGGFWTKNYKFSKNSFENTRISLNLTQIRRHLLVFKLNFKMQMILVICKWREIFFRQITIYSSRFNQFTIFFNITARINILLKCNLEDVKIANLNCFYFLFRLWLFWGTTQEKCIGLLTRYYQQPSWPPCSRWLHGGLIWCR